MNNLSRTWIAFSAAAARAPARALVAVSASLLALACSGEGGGPGGMQAPPATVSVARVVQRPVTEWDEFTGRIEAVDTVEIRPRVAGYLDAVHFVEGSVVAQGDLLFTIDEREYRAAVAVAEANLERAVTRISLAEQELQRSEQLITAQAVSQEELDQRLGELRSAQADRSSAQAQLVQAQLNLSFARISAPIAGRIGAAVVKPGNLVAPGETLLTTLVSIDPVYVAFEADENAFLAYNRQTVSAERLAAPARRLPVRVGLANEDGFPHAGELDFLDNRLDPGTGTIRARAVLANPHGLFVPGLFARVRLLGEQRPALLIHDMAILTDQDRQYVYVVGADNRAERRDIRIGRQMDGLRVVTQGLSAADEVVVNGVRRIFFPGAPLIAEPVPMDDPLAAAGAPGAAGTDGVGR
ncbi:MAG: efflux RND transporter periplasmic adaptor subunit [Rhodospirillaceae bacterium]|nr:efflux RND transporter periplasmic adaptor subunit [Rhodospirillaceae bacterium]